MPKESCEKIRILEFISEKGSLSIKRLMMIIAFFVGTVGYFLNLPIYEWLSFICVLGGFTTWENIKK